MSWVGPLTIGCTNPMVKIRTEGEALGLPFALENKRASLQSASKMKNRNIQVWVTTLVPSRIKWRTLCCQKQEDQALMTKSRIVGANPLLPKIEDPSPFDQTKNSWVNPMFPKIEGTKPS